MACQTFPSVLTSSTLSTFSRMYLNPAAFSGSSAICSTPAAVSASIRPLKSPFTASRSNIFLFSSAEPVSLSGAATTPFDAMSVSLIL